MGRIVMDGWTHLLQSKSSILAWRLLWLLLSDIFCPTKTCTVSHKWPLGLISPSIFRGHCCTCGCCMCWPVRCWCRFVMKRADLTVQIQPWGWPETWGAVTKHWYLKRGEWKPTVHKEIRAAFGVLPTFSPWFPDFWLVQIIVYACKFRDEVNATGQFRFRLLCQCSRVIKNPQKDLSEID